MHKETDLKCVVVTTEANYYKLMQVADMPNLYHGYVTINSNKNTPHYIVKETWKLIEKLQSERRSEAIEEVKSCFERKCFNRLARYISCCSEW